MADCAQVIAGDPEGCVLVEDVAAVAQAQSFATRGGAEGHSQNEAFREPGILVRAGAEYHLVCSGSRRPPRLRPPGPLGAGPDLPGARR